MPVTIGGVEINPGDVIMGDDDGVVVLGNDLTKIQVTFATPDLVFPRTTEHSLLCQATNWLL